MTSLLLALAGCGNGGGDGGGPPDAGEEADGSGGGVLSSIQVPDGPPAAEESHPPCEADEDCPGDLPRCVPPGLCFACAVDDDCEVWQRCTEGACVPRVCDDGDTACLHDTWFVCAGDEDLWQGQPCAPGTCTLEGCGACVPETLACAGASVVVCDAEGTGYVTAQACPTGEQCAHGTCVQCTEPGVGGCHQGNAVVCDLKGRWELVEKCASQGLECSLGACSACEPGTETCIAQVSHCKVDGTVSPLTDCWEAGLLCWEGACEPMCSDYDFKQGSAGDCPDGACCRYGDGTLAIIGKDSCEPSGGDLAPWSLCQEPVCCRDPDTLIDLELTVGHCGAKGGEVVAPEVCGAEVCCVLGGGGVLSLPLGKCLDGGHEADESLCVPGDCCEQADGTWTAMDQAACVEAGGTPVTEALCAGPVAASSTSFDVTLEANSGCVPASRIVIPSSSGNQLAFYDLDSLELAFAPVTVCVNPSRLVVAGTGDVYSVCRGDGRVVRVSPTGEVVWNQQLPTCAAARGIALDPTGRLFAGCSSPGVLFEVDPETGETIDGAFANSASVYGMAVDGTGLYIAGGYGISKFDVSGDDIVAVWTRPHTYYGVAVDGNGTVWVGGVGVSALDGADGSTVESWEVDLAFVHGVTVGPDGLIYAAIPYMPAGGQGYVVIQPGLGVVDVRKLPHAVDYHPKGVALDGSGNAYTVNLVDASVAKFLPDGQVEVFGKGQLVWPYAYNGDLTGVTTACVTGGTKVYESGPLPGGAEDTLWVDVSWETTMPEGVPFAISYQLGGSDAWTVVPASGSYLMKLAPDIRFRLAVSSLAPTEVPLQATITVRHVP